MLATLGPGTDTGGAEALAAIGIDLDRVRRRVEGRGARRAAPGRLTRPAQPVSAWPP